VIFNVVTPIIFGEDDRRGSLYKTFIPSGGKLSYAVARTHEPLLTVHVLPCRLGLKKEALQILKSLKDNV
jgi:hypothetical protein